MFVCVRMPLLLDYGYLKTLVFRIQVFAVIAASPLRIDLSCVLEHNDIFIFNDAQFLVMIVLRITQ